MSVRHMPTYDADTKQISTATRKAYALPFRISPGEYYRGAGARQPAGIGQNIAIQRTDKAGVKSSHAFTIAGHHFRLTSCLGRVQVFTLLASASIFVYGSIKNFGECGKILADGDDIEQMPRRRVYLP